MYRRNLLRLSAAAALALAAPTILLAKGKNSYRGKHGLIKFDPQGDDGFLLEVAGLKYSGKLSSGIINHLKAGTGDGDHVVSIDGSPTNFSIDRGKLKIDLENGKALIQETIPQVGPVVVIILIIIIIHGRWPPKPGRRVTIDVDGNGLELNPV